MPVYLCLLFALYIRCFFFLVFLSSILVGGFSVMFFSNFLFKKKLLLFLAVVGRHCCVGFSYYCGRQGLCSGCSAWGSLQ